MHSRTVEQVRTWDSRPFSGGLGTLYELSEDDHTGAVVARDTWLFMLNGRVIGIFEGTMDDFEESGTVYVTSEDSLPLLFAMQEREGRTRAKYFTEETSLEDADKTLADANFTGYIELSENVLSGDYYLVYYGGTRRSAAFIGQSERVETGDAAFEKAAEEVGLYEVKDVSMTITEIPAPKERTAGTAETDAEPEAAPETDAEPAVASAAGAAKKGGTTATEEVETETVTADAERETGTEESEAETATADVETDTSTGDAKTDTDRADEEAAQETAKTGETDATAAATEPGGDIAEAESVTETEESAADRSPPSAVESTDDGVEGEITDATTDETTETSQRESRERSRSTAESTDTASTPAKTAAEERAADAEATTDADSELEKMFRAEAEWRQTRAIPALDPDQTEPTDDTSKAAASSTGGSRSRSSRAQETSRSANTRKQRSETARFTGSKTRSRKATPNAERRSSPEEVASEPDTGASQAADGRMKKLEAAVKKRDVQIEDLESRLADVERKRSDLSADLEDEQAERSRLESELVDLREERDQLKARVGELEAAIEGDGTVAGEEATALDPETALAGTNLFVRYGSKSEPTLEALGPEVDPEAVNANLTLEHHTKFETDTVQVDGRPYREFLEGTGEFRFVSWVLRDLPYELLETGNRSSLGDLFEAISAIDRIELEGSVTVDAESGTDREFALVMRDRMGNPLIVGEYNDDRNPVVGSELETLLDGARDVAGSVESLAGAFYVTASFFEPAALESAENAASKGGLFSRQEKASYVTPDSGTGFHLGLVEDRSQAFHVTVPKL